MCRLRRQAGERGEPRVAVAVVRLLLDRGERRLVRRRASPPGRDGRRPASRTTGPGRAAARRAARTAASPPGRRLAGSRARSAYLAREHRRRARPRKPAPLGDDRSEQRRAILRPDDAVRGQSSPARRRARPDPRRSRRDPARRAARACSAERAASRSRSCGPTTIRSPMPAHLPCPPRLLASMAGTDKATTVSKERIADELEAARERDAEPARAVLGRGACPAGVRDHVAARLGPRPHRALRGALDLTAAGRPRAAASRTATISTTPSPTSGASARRCHCSTLIALARTSQTSAAGRSTCSTRSSSTPRTPCSATASPSAS